MSDRWRKRHFVQNQTPSDTPTLILWISTTFMWIYMGAGESRSWTLRPSVPSRAQEIGQTLSSAQMGFPEVGGPALRPSHKYTDRPTLGPDGSWRLPRATAGLRLGPGPWSAAPHAAHTVWPTVAFWRLRFVSGCLAPGVVTSSAQREDAPPVLVKLSGRTGGAESRACGRHPQM